MENYEKDFNPQNLLNELYDLSNYSHSLIFNNCQYPWNTLNQLQTYIQNYLKQANVLKNIMLPPNAWVDENVFIGQGTIINNGVTIKGPSIIGNNCQLRPGAYIRGNVIIGNNCLIGNSCEIKNSIIMNNVQIAHFNYVGDSILGNGSHLAAGAITSNLKLDSSQIKLKFGERVINTGLKKIGAMIGDKSEIGCNCVMNPGSIIGKNCILYPTILLRRNVPSNTIMKVLQTQQLVIRKSSL